MQGNQDHTFGEGEFARMFAWAERGVGIFDARLPRTKLTVRALVGAGSSLCSVRRVSLRAYVGIVFGILQAQDGSTVGVLTGDTGAVSAAFPDR